MFIPDILQDQCMQSIDSELVASKDLLKFDLYSRKTLPNFRNGSFFLPGSRPSFGEDFSLDDSRFCSHFMITKGFPLFDIS